MNLSQQLSTAANPQALLDGLVRDCCRYLAMTPLSPGATPLDTRSEEERRRFPDFINDEIIRGAVNALRVEVVDAPQPFVALSIGPVPVTVALSETAEAALRLIVLALEYPQYADNPVAASALLEALDEDWMVFAARDNAA